MNWAGRAHAQEQDEQREQATRQATDLIRADRGDPNAWVRLLVTSGIGDETVYHFDAYWPTQKPSEQSRVVVQHVALDRWVATFVDDSSSTASTSSTASLR